ncbi:MAG: type II secretory pathway, component PulD [Opitutus sp.]|nr:type II secretory pathway, component PulD [Opitutus sp.]
MTPRFARLFLAALLSAFTLDARAQTPPAPAGPPPPAPAARANPDDELINAFKMQDGSIDDVLSTLELWTGRMILRAGTMAVPTAGYRIVFPKPMPKSDAILVLLTVLQLNGVGVTTQGDNAYIITPLVLTKNTAPEMITGSTLEQPASGKIATKIFQLEFMRVQELSQMLQSILNPGLQGLVPLLNANAALITDTVSNLQRVELLLQTVDRPVIAGMVPKFYPVRNANATALVGKLNAMLGAPALRAQLGTATTFSADDRTNQIVLFADPRQYPIFDELIAKLDTPADPHTRNEVIYLKHAKSPDVVNTLSRLISAQTAATRAANSQSVRPGQGGIQPITLQPAPGIPVPPAAPIVAAIASNAGNAGTDGAGSSTNEFSSLMNVVSDDRSNAIVVTGTPDDIRLIKDLIEKLDITLAQVRIEVVIAEVTVDDNHTSGFSALGLKLDGDKLIGFSGAATGVSVTSGTVTRPGLRGGFDLAAEIAIGTSPRTSNSTIFSVPAIVTSHGKEGTIFNGETRPVVTNTQSTATTVGTPTISNSVTPQEIGTTLTVTPFIGNDGSVTLDITQDVSDVTGTVTIGSDTQYIIGKRKTKSTVSTKSGDIHVLGGFQKKTNSRSTSRLGPIPFLGDLFGTRNKDIKHQELIFFLRTTVLTNTPADNDVVMKRVDQLPTKDEIRRELDPTYVAPPQTLLQKILPK